MRQKMATNEPFGFLLRKSKSDLSLDRIGMSIHRKECLISVLKDIIVVVDKMDTDKFGHSRAAENEVQLLDGNADKRQEDNLPGFQGIKTHDTASTSTASQNDFDRQKLVESRRYKQKYLNISKDYQKILHENTQLLAHLNERISGGLTEMNLRWQKFNQKRDIQVKKYLKEIEELQVQIRNSTDSRGVITFTEAQQIKETPDGDPQPDSVRRKSDCDLDFVGMQKWGGQFNVLENSYTPSQAGAREKPNYGSKGCDARKFNVQNKSQGEISSGSLRKDAKRRRWLNHACRIIEEKLSTNEHKFMRHGLRLEPQEIDKLDHGFRSSVEKKVMHALEIWKNREGKGATADKLLDILEDVGRKDIKETIQEIFDSAPEEGWC